MSRSYLSDKKILVVSKPLAKALGVAMSIVLRRVQHWLEHNENDEDKALSHFHDGHWWTFNGYQKWTDDIEIYSKSTIKRLFTDLEKLGLLISTSKYNKRKGDQTKWYTINYEAYDAFIVMWNQHGCPLHKDGKKPKEYQAFIDQWTTVGIPTVVPPIDHSDTTNRPQWVQQETTVGSPLPESPSDVSTNGSTESEIQSKILTAEEAKRFLSLPTHLQNFELRSMNSHPIIDGYSEALGTTYIASDKDKISAIRAQIAGYTRDDAKELTASKIKDGKTTYPFSWMITDLATTRKQPPPGSGAPSPNGDPPDATPEEIAGRVAALRNAIENRRGASQKDSA